MGQADAFLIDWDIGGGGIAHSDLQDSVVIDNFNESSLPAELISCLIYLVRLASKEGFHPNPEEKLHPL